jgi:arabinofuranosyltransferase
MDAMSSPTAATATRAVTTERTGPIERADERRRTTVAAVGVGLCGLALAWLLRFVQDDAYITFRYSQHLAEGSGPVWELGERVQGFTNPLWTLLLAGVIRLGGDPVLWSQLLGLACYAGTLAITWRAAQRLLATSTQALGALVAVVVCISFTAYATGGLETPLQALLVTAVAAVVLRVHDDASLPTTTAVGISVLAGLALLCRLDSVVIVAPWLVLALRSDRSVDLRDGRWRAPRATPVAALFVPGLVLAGGWALWAWSYYGSPLPNTLAAKSGGALGGIRFGAVYLVLFVLSYGLFMLVPGFVASVREMLRSAAWQTLLVVLAIWSGYVLVVGDFMEFRFMVPVIPLIGILAVRCLVASPRRWRWASVAVMSVLSLTHVAVPQWTQMVSGFAALQQQISGVNGDDGWEAVGERLRQLFPPESGAARPRIAVGPAGVIPYLSELPSVDILGLNDEWVARNGIRTDDRPGHRVRAPMSYLVDREVVLLVDTPLIVDGPQETYDMADVASMSGGHLDDLGDLPEGASIVEVPLVGGRVLAVVQLRDHPAVDALVAAGELRRVPIS